MKRVWQHNSAVVRVLRPKSTLCTHVTRWHHASVILSWFRLMLEWTFKNYHRHLIRHLFGNTLNHEWQHECALWIHRQIEVHWLKWTSNQYSIVRSMISKHQTNHRRSNEWSNHHVWICRVWNKLQAINLCWVHKASKTEKNKIKEKLRHYS